MFVSEIVPLILSFLLGMCVLYFTVYSKAKRKNRVLQEAIFRLENEKELANGRAEKEESELPLRKQSGIAPTEIKKPLAVDIEKIECSCDEKRQLFVKYFTLLDEFHRKNNAIFTLQFHPIMNRFLASNSVEDKTARNRAIVEFNREVQSLFNQLYEEQHKVISETNSIRSFSSATLDKLLNKLESAVKKSTDDASEVLKFMATPELWADLSLAAPLQKAENSVQMVLTCRNAVRRRMKVELHEIQDEEHAVPGYGGRI